LALTGERKSGNKLAIENELDKPFADSLFADRKKDLKPDS